MNALLKLLRILSISALASFALFAACETVFADDSVSGETGFKTYCSACHFEGGNMINAEKTLSKADREKNGIRSARDIINLMRKPGEGMTVFDEKTVTDTEAQQIADYILRTFK